jgi:hypothetical protein
MIGTTLMSFTDTLVNLTLIPIYTFNSVVSNAFFYCFYPSYSKENHEQLKIY